MLNKELTKEEIKHFIDRLEKLETLSSDADTLENKLYQFIACSHFSFLYGNFCRKNPLFALRKTATHKLVSKRLKTLCIRVNDALLKTSLNEKKVIDIVQGYIQYLIAVENSTMSAVDQRLAKAGSGFDLNETKKEARGFRLELEQRLSDHRITLQSSATIVRPNPTIPLTEPLIKKEEKTKHSDQESDPLSNPSNKDLKGATIAFNRMSELSLEEEVEGFSRDTPPLKPINESKTDLKSKTIEPAVMSEVRSDEFKKSTTETNSKNYSNFIHRLMKILTGIVRRFSTWVNQLCCCTRPSSFVSETETPIAINPQPYSANPKQPPLQFTINDYVYQSPIQKQQRQQANQGIASTENLEGITSSISLNNWGK